MCVLTRRVLLRHTWLVCSCKRSACEGMEFPAIQRQRNSRKCNISASRERHSLGQDKVCSVLWEVARTVKRLEFTCRFILGPHLTNGRLVLMFLK